MNKKVIHLICNAHLDPVWLWEWEEGAAEALSTFRTAADICEENDNFVFNHNEVILYRWIQEYEPVLFKRIQKLVKQGKWHIMGGWYLQPDCNMPSGESLVRQILLGRDYFKKYFNAKPTTAINFDPFGHTRGLVQILTKCGYDSYLFGRPAQVDCALPDEDFIWVGFDGSEVLARRSWEYNSKLGEARKKVEKSMNENGGQDLSVLLWGVGNHGGGPSRKDISDINKLIKKSSKEWDIRHSTPEQYFKDLKKKRGQLSRHEDGLNPWAVGCYTSMCLVKQRYRQLENELYSLEKMLACASMQGLMVYPEQELEEAFYDLMLGQFHDILPGSAIEPVEDASIRMLDHGLEISSRLKARAFFALSSGQRKAAKDTIPIFVYNPHPFKVQQVVECEFNLPDVNYTETFTDVIVKDENKKLSSQVEQELSNIPTDWRKRVVFNATLEPSQMNRFDCDLEVIKSKPAVKLKPVNGKLKFKTKELEVVINTKTGLVDQYKVNGVNCVGKNTFEPLVMNDNEDPWGMLTKSFGEVIGSFKLMSKRQGSAFSGLKKQIDSVRVIEDGDVRSVIEAVFSYGSSSLRQLYKLPKKGTEIEVESNVYWNEKSKMLKLSVPVAGSDNEYFGQVAFGVQKLPDNGQEAVAQKWTAVVSQKCDFAITCVNEGVYGSDYSKAGLRLTLLRSPSYSAHPHGDRKIVPQNRYTPRVDQGKRTFKFWFNSGKLRKMMDSVDRVSLVKNEKPFSLSFFPSGEGNKAKPVAILDSKSIQMVCIKKANSQNEWVIRLFETTGNARKAVLELPLLKKKISLDFNKFEIKTLKLNLRTSSIKEAEKIV